MGILINHCIQNSCFCVHKYRHKYAPRRIYKRIMSILCRIVILTIMFEIIYIFWVIISVYRTTFGETDLIQILYETLSGFVSVVVCYSMFLMQQHNDNEYKKFLNVLFKYNLYQICCCCKSLVIYEMGLDLINNTAQNDIDKNRT